VAIKKYFRKLNSTCENNFIDLKSLNLVDWNNIVLWTFNYIAISYLYMKPKKRLDSMGNQVEFSYQKSNLHRVIKVDGAWGGIVPLGGIQMSVFSEIRPFPASEKYQISEDGKTAHPITPSKKNTALTREIETTLIMSPSVAKSLATWLTIKVEEYEKMIAGESFEIVNHPFDSADSKDN
jgi:hypothetical protein